MKKSWKTTVFGILSLSLAGFQIYTNPATATDPNIMAAVATGLGLIMAKDAEKVPKKAKKAKVTLIEGEDPPPDIPPGPDNQ
jgi:hypothetical protein